jgi:hypothetical protein
MSTWLKRPAACGREQAVAAPVVGEGAVDEAALGATTVDVEVDDPAAGVVGAAPFDEELLHDAASAVATITPTAIAARSPLRRLAGRRWSTGAGYRPRATDRRHA